MKYHLPKTPVLANEQTGEDIFLLSLRAAEIAGEAQPGQFVHLKASEGIEPLLRRPLSICRVDRGRGVIQLWYQAVGRGTSYLSQLASGDSLDLIGPLGRGFDVEITGKKTALVGGGMGIAPLIFLAGVLREHNDVTAFFGGKKAAQMPPDILLPAVLYHSATEDGSHGYRGLVTALLPEWIEHEKPDRIYACGPKGMLREMVAIAGAYRLPLQVSLETVMACGVGACLGCACAKSATGEDDWLKACQDGPVFWSQEVKWS